MGTGLEDNSFCLFCEKSLSKYKHMLYTCIHNKYTKYSPVLKNNLETMQKVNTQKFKRQEFYAFLVLFGTRQWKTRKVCLKMYSHT